MSSLKALGLSQLTVSTSPQSPRPAFPTEKQQQSNWCWAAVTAALISHLGKAARTQCEIVGAWKGQNSCPPAPAINEQASLDHILNSVVKLPAAYRGAAFFSDPAAAFAAICDSIDNGRPVPLIVAWSNTWAMHCVCAFGHTTVGGEPALWIFDPWPAWSLDGHVRLRTVSSMRRYEQTPDGSASLGYWAEAYLLE